MNMSRLIIEMTPFIFEDGNTYYFEIYKRPSNNDYHDLYVYEKNSYTTWYGSKKEKYLLLNDSPELVDISLNSRDIKSDITKILTATKAKYAIKDWDGFVGNVPDDIKKAILRNSKLDNLGIDG